jgi:hypothetical protein
LPPPNLSNQLHNQYFETSMNSPRPLRTQ